MGFDYGLIPVIVFSGLACFGVTIFFKRYGAFKHHWIVWSLMIISAYIPYIMVVGILPYDISLCLFGSAVADHHSLRMTLEVFYWVSFVLTWVINPLIVSYLRYPYSLTLKRRIWLTIRENLIFWGSIAGVVVVGLIILLATHQLTFNNIFPLAISLANGYGLLVLCFCLGHGLAAIPRSVWNKANPAAAYLYCLQKISRETTLCSVTIADGDACLVHCQNANDKLVGKLKQQWEEKGIPRMNRLSRIKGELPIPDRCKVGESKNKKVKKLRKMKWEKCTEMQLEDFFELLDDICLDIEQTASYVNDSALNALKCLRRYKKKISKASVIMFRALAVLLFIINLICLWSELCLIFDIRYSIFYIISHVAMPQIVSIICVSTPILAYLLVVGSWSLRHLKLGSFFRFIAGATNANTLNYFSIILCRLGPTIGFHYMQQIGAYDSEFQKVMGVMNVVVFIGTKWNIYAPILLAVIMIFVFFNIIDRICFACGKDPLTYNTSIMHHTMLQNGEEVLAELQPEAKSLIMSGYRYTNVLDQAKLFGKKTDDKSSLDENLLNDVREI
ncbi:hypothetical protein TRFO_05276 [Tritrichomonas foetus]|uniref:LMBR1-like conserved region family protein n=1 Tax=Tritrichomonas foetus TaxID=1144522 RepID=A0A1J4K6U0_9EUKA|nr:hypothetical protein TRFO_05276 [Tritrichomonas foetus]|eukprot:OHT07079.1 hypothetical protein TRFO_05276 [Tritrichomonas foetus]